MQKVLSVLVVSAATFGMSFSTNADNLGVKRTIMQIKNATVISPMTALSTVDFGRVKMKNTKSDPNSPSIYNQTDADKLNADAKAHFMALTGLDIDTAVPNAQFIPTIYNAQGKEIAWVIPFSVGADDLYRVLYDSKKPKKNHGKWTIRNNSTLVIFQKNGKFKGGSLQGQPYENGSVLSYGYTDHLRLGKDWTNNKFRENFTVYTTRPGATVMNSLGKSEYHVPLTYKTANGKIGYGSDNTYVEVKGPAGDGQETRSITHHVITFFAQDN